MDSLHIFILSITQGFTEFLPISSSAHLILIPQFFNYPDQGLSFDVAVHLGSLLAVMLYFKQEIWSISYDLIQFGINPKHPQTPDSLLGLHIMVATVPIVIIGYLFKHLIATDLRSLSVIAGTTIIFGLLLYWVDKNSVQKRTEKQMTWKQALFIGSLQVVALIPGTSRSGITITAALMIGLTREAAARFSFLLSIPTIFMSGTLVTYELIQQQQPVDWFALGQGSLLAFIAAYACITLFLKTIERIGMLPFVLYRLLLGSFLIIVIIGN